MFMNCERKMIRVVPAGCRAPGNQSGRGKLGWAQSLLGKAVQEKIGKLCSAQASRRSILVTSTKPAAMLLVGYAQDVQPRVRHRTYSSHSDRQ